MIQNTQTSFQAGPAVEFFSQAAQAATDYSARAAAAPSGVFPRLGREKPPIFVADGRRLGGGRIRQRLREGMRRLCSRIAGRFCAGRRQQLRRLGAGDDRLCGAKRGRV